MACDLALVERIRRIVGPRPDVTEKQKFGGIMFLYAGTVFAGVLEDELYVHVGEADHAAAITRPHARAFDFTGFPSTGFVFVAGAGATTVGDVKPWITQALAYVATLPVKERPQKSWRKPGRR